MVDEGVSEAVCAQPVRECINMGIVFVRMTDEQYGHRPRFAWLDRAAT
jgi:hypothetical protein